jgi:hypothetical protein
MRTWTLFLLNLMGRTMMEQLFRRNETHSPQSEEIVKQLEKGLPKWPGFGEEGWMKEVHLVSR